MQNILFMSLLFCIIFLGSDLHSFLLYFKLTFYFKLSFVSYSEPDGISLSATLLYLKNALYSPEDDRLRSKHVAII